VGSMELLKVSVKVVKRVAYNENSRSVPVMIHWNRKPIGLLIR